MITHPAMGQERLSHALGRIEKAVARIEAAAARQPAAPDGSRGSDDPALRHAHETLRGKVASAIAQIDRLLETEGAR